MQPTGIVGRKAMCGLALILVAALGTARGQNGSQLQDWDAFSKQAAGAAARKMDCKALVSLTGYDFAITQATLLPASGDVPEHCRVAGLVLPEIQFEVNLPTA